MNDTRRMLAAATLLTVTLVTSGPRQAASETNEPQGISVTAERFTFTPSEIRVRAGIPAEIRLRSDDTAHGFHVAGTSIDVLIPKRGRGEAVVKVDLDPGRYEFECSQICGAGHDFMRGVLIVAK